MSKWFRGEIILSLMITLSLSSVAIAHKSEKLCKGYFPPNNLNIPVNDFVMMGIGQDMFNQTIDRAEKIYGPIIQAKGGRLDIQRLWSDGTVNAAAGRSGNTWTVEMYGGLARHGEITEEAFAAVLCHEIGHHIGGAPRYSGDWASNEGQSDYYSVTKCMRYMYENEDNEAWLATIKIDAFAANRCQQQFSMDRKEELLCLRSAYAGQSIARMFQALDGSGTEAKFDTPDTKVVSRTNANHPDPQCRLDTLFNGATCKVDKSVELGSDVLQGTCNQGMDQYGWRPRCWYKP